jgi:hypothetical protein
MENSRLYQALKNFKGVNGVEADLPKEFKKVANAAFYSGRFCINRGTKDEFYIELTRIEFYYHEDDGDVKDKAKYLRGDNEFNYPIGAIIPHSSGLDVLFDDVDKKFHASFLIRGYRTIEKSEDPELEEEKVSYENKDEKHPYWKAQDLWYDLMGQSNMLKYGHFCIEWIDNGAPYDVNKQLPTMERVRSQKPFGDGREWCYIRKD